MVLVTRYNVGTNSWPPWFTATNQKVAKKHLNELGFSGPNDHMYSSKHIGKDEGGDIYDNVMVEVIDHYEE